jgi:segregation and condensation protein B
MTDEMAIDKSLNMTANLEALLFVAPGLVSVTQLATALEISTSEVEKGLEALADKYAGQDSGLRLQNYRGRYQLTTAPQAAEQIERFLGLEATSRLSRAALEALSIVAYRQPTTRPQVDAIRGVNSDYVLKSLLSKGVIEEIGRAESPGRPILYGTTPEFLQYFGLESLDDLPPLNLGDVDQDSEQNGQIEILKE